MAEILDAPVSLIYLSTEQFQPIPLDSTAASHVNEKLALGIISGNLFFAAEDKKMRMTVTHWSPCILHDIKEEVLRKLNLPYERLRFTFCDRILSDEENLLLLDSREQSPIRVWELKPYWLSQKGEKKKKQFFFEKSDRICRVKDLLAPIVLTQEKPHYIRRIWGMRRGGTCLVELKDTDTLNDLVDQSGMEVEVKRGWEV
jgi:hypothetical protein